MPHLNRRYEKSYWKTSSFSFISGFKYDFDGKLSTFGSGILLYAARVFAHNPVNACACLM